MSAGRGVYHSEFNASKTEPLELLQIWVEPKQTGIPPSYEQANFRLTSNQFTTLVDGTQGRKVDDALYIHQNAKFLLGEFEKGEKILHAVDEGKAIYLFVISGAIQVGTQVLSSRDAAAARGMLAAITLDATVVEKAKILLLEVPL